MHFNIGDIIATLIMFGFFAFVILVVAWILRSSKKRINQLDSIEQKIDALSEKINKHNE